MKGSFIYRRILCAILILSIVCSFALPSSAAVISGKTGIGMAEWALRAYNEGWKYVYGGSTEGTIDCSGLIRSYCNGRGGGAKALLDASSESGDIKTIPRVHGLGLWCEGHAGVYVGKSEDGTDMVVDARNSRVNVVYSELNSRHWSPWVKWFKIGMISYPTTGWYDFNGSTYYYHNGEFVIGHFTVDGITYDFGKSGALKGKATESTTTTSAATSTTTTKTTTTTQSTTTSTTKTTTTTKATTKTTTTASTTESETKTTATAETQKYKALRYGERSDEVTALQIRLVELGYLGAAPSGYYGTQTEAAVRLFQKAADLKVDGIAGNETQEKLYSKDAPLYGTTTTETTTTTATTVTETTTATTTATSATEITESTDIETEPTQPEVISPTDSIEEIPGWETEYTRLEIGSTGEAVTALQEKLRSKGFYEQPLTSYYGSFTRDAVMRFQLSAGVEATGAADEYTQYLLFNDLTAGNSQSEKEYGEEYYELGGDLYDSLGIESAGGVLEQSQGLLKYSKTAAPEQFISRYGNVGGLSTLGAFSQSEPVTVIYKNGESYELTSEALEELEGSIFN